jgi:hypothetical protein
MERTKAIAALDPAREHIRTMETGALNLALGVSIGYTPRMMKDSGLRIRVERELRERFLELCRTQDRPAAQIIREFMREYVAKHGPSNDAAVRRRPLKRERDE